MPKTPTIGYMNLTLTQEWAYVPWNGIVRRARERGVRLLSFHGNAVGHSDPDGQQPNIIYALARQGRLDGLVVWKGHLTAALDEAGILDFYRSFGIPLVTIEGLARGFPGVTYGNLEGMRLMTDHLIEEHGHRAIGFVGVSDFHVFAQRLEGYRRSLKAHGIAEDKRFLVSAFPWVKEENGSPPEKRFDAWLKSALDAGARAFIGVCDPVALWIMERAQALGLSVPRDLAVAGYDGFPSSRASLPSLTTVNPDWEGLGSVALDAILDIFDGKRVQEELRVSPRLVRARSCGCVEENVLRAAGKRDKRLVRSKADGPASRSDASRTRAEALAPAFAEARRSGRPEAFLDALDEGLRRSISAGDDLQAWQDAITELAAGAGRKFRGPFSQAYCSGLLDQARVLVSDAVEHAMSRRADFEANLAGKERALGQALITSFDSGKILEALAEGLPGLGVESAWLSLYEAPRPYRYPEDPPEWSRLVLALENGIRAPLPEGGLRFSSRDLIPDQRWPASPDCLAVEPIRFNLEQIGFIVMKATEGRGPLYSALASQISAGLRGAHLVGEIETRSRALEAGVASLSVSGEQMFRSMEAVSASISRQADAVQEEASAITELDRNIAGIARISKESLEVSRSLDAKASQGAASLKALLEVMRGLQEHSRDFLGLIGMIQEFADMTKLLAFNAAVEAARLGLAGRGFNVIAKDIRVLAENADSNAKRIGDIVGRVAALIDQASEISRETGAGLDGILLDSGKNAQYSDSLSAAMEEQARGLDSMLESTRMLTGITDEIRSSISEQTKAMGDLRDALAILKDSSQRRPGSAAGPET